MKFVRRVMEVSGDVAFAVLKVVFFVGPNSKPKVLNQPAESGSEQFCPHREHMRQAAKLQRDEEDRRRRNWGTAAFSHSRS
jgi:hypothetical protein